jgi:three-Cys-motif partner protein
MSGRDLHQSPFDEGTQDKLDLYRRYLRKWLPVFLHQPVISTINVFDFFAGPGSDPEGAPASPVIAHQEICDAIRSRKSTHEIEVNLYLNEFNANKFIKLRKWAQQSLIQTDFVNVHTERLDFNEAFEKWLVIAKKRQTANLLLLDQYGVKFVTRDVFITITRLLRTDFLFYISSSIIKRFKNEDSIRKCVPVTEEDLKKMNKTNVHRIVTEAYRSLIPSGTEYYLAPFSIRKGGNVYGLIFGSRHPLGMDKFLSECWRKDRLRGEANFDIDEEGIDMSMPSLFPEMNKPKKLTQFETELSSAILARQVKTNVDIYLFALKRGFRAKDAKQITIDMIKDKRLPKQSVNVSNEAWQKGKPEQIRYPGGALP